MRGALGFLTILGRSAAPTPTALRWFPVVGALIGLAVGGTWIGTEQVWPAAVAAALALAVDAIVTGFLHLDGLADAGDGLLPPMSADRRLAVMADARVGAFGVITVAVVLLVRYAAFVAGPARVWVVVAVWCASRTAVALVVLVARYARAAGLVDRFLRSRNRASAAVTVAALGLAISVPLALIDRPAHGLSSLGTVFLTSALVTWAAHRRIGGYTGDVLGAQIVVAETVGLLVWTARW